jgi:parallel beta-helix repeat protein
MYIDRALNITSTDQTAQIINGTITILNSGSGTNITRLKINNTLDCCKGIYLLNTTNNTIKENIIHCDGITGYGICLVGSSYNQIIENNLSESNAINGWQHSPIILGDSHYNDINYNYIVSNVSNNIYLCTYSFADYSNGNPSTYNNIIGNTLFGVDNSWCYAIQIMGLYNTISNNTITGAYRGISSDLSTEMGGEITGGSNIITGNTISATNCGIYFGSNCTVAENTINS